MLLKTQIKDFSKIRGKIWEKNSFPEFSENELNQIAIGLANNFKFKGDKKILEDLVKFHKTWASYEDIKDDVQCFKVREIAASVKAFSEGRNILDTIMTIKRQVRKVIKKLFFISRLIIT